MNVGMFIYSQTGHTLSIAEKVKEKLSAAGHTVDLKLISLVGGRTSGDRQFTFEALPDPTSYDAVIFGSAVEAFSLSPVMSRYLKQVGSLAGKRAACLVTQQFPFPWMGGNHAIRQMKRLCEGKGAEVVASGIVNWSSSRRGPTTARAVESLTAAFPMQ